MEQKQRGPLIRYSKKYFIFLLNGNQKLDWISKFSEIDNKRFGTDEFEASLRYIRGEGSPRPPGYYRSIESCGNLISYVDLASVSKEDGRVISDYNFLHYIDEYRLKKLPDIATNAVSNLRIPPGIKDPAYTLFPGEMLKIIIAQLNNPSKKILRSRNHFYISTTMETPVRILIEYQRPTAKRFSKPEISFSLIGSGFDSSFSSIRKSDRVFFACGLYYSKK